MRGQEVPSFRTLTIEYEGIIITMAIQEYKHIRVKCLAHNAIMTLKRCTETGEEWLSHPIKGTKKWCNYRFSTFGNHRRNKTMIARIEE